jgi:hypothetical protein
MNPETPTTLRWLIENRWSSASLKDTAYNLCSEIVQAAITRDPKSIHLDTAYTLRWHINNNWGSTQAPQEALQLIDKIVGYPSSRTPRPPKPSVPIDAPAPVVVEFQNGDLPPIKDVVWLVPPGTAFPIVGVAFTPDQFEAYINSISRDAMQWSPSGITIHHAAAPSLAQRPRGFETQHMHNLRSYYRGLGWSRGPHLFVDDHRIWVFSPLTARSIHAVSFNSTHLSIEMLGNYDVEDPKSGRGAAVIDLTARATVAMQRRFKIPTVNFHRDDPKTDKSCPGTKITKQWLEEQLNRAAAA